MLLRVQLLNQSEPVNGLYVLPNNVNLSAALPAWPFGYVSQRDHERLGLLLTARDEAHGEAQHAAAAVVVAAKARDERAGALRRRQLMAATAAGIAAGADAEAARLALAPADAVALAAAAAPPPAGGRRAAAPPHVRAFSTTQAAAALRPSLQQGASRVLCQVCVCVCAGASSVARARARRARFSRLAACQVWQLLHGDTQEVRDALLASASSADLSLTVVTDNVAVRGVYAALGETAGLVVLERLAESGRCHRGVLQPGANPQQLLNLPPVAHPGFLGYLVRPGLWWWHQTTPAGGDLRCAHALHPSPLCPAGEPGAPHARAAGLPLRPAGRRGPGPPRRVGPATAAAGPARVGAVQHFWGEEAV